MDTQPGSRPLISLVVPIYGVEAYLPAFLKSIDVQVGAHDGVEVILVDDGSLDGSGRIAREWTRATSMHARLVEQSNGGLSSARNTGVDSARGEWVSFPDPDDILSPGYLSEVMRAIMSPEIEAASVIATNLVYFRESTGQIEDTHPLRGTMRGDARVVRLRDDPQLVKISAATTFFRLDTIVRVGLKFDERVRPNFEDGAFYIRYQRSFDDPAIAFAPAARYLYRRRADESSLVASSWSKPEKYTNVPRFGWLAPLEELAADDADVPLWAQYIVLYDMSWYFRYDAWIHTPTRSISSEVKAEFMDLVRQVLRLIDVDAIAAYAVTDISLQARLALVALRGMSLPLDAINLWRADRFKPLVQLKYYFSGSRPKEAFTAAGEEIKPVFAKDRSVVYFDEVVLRERILWLPARDALQVLLGGQRCEIRYGPPRNRHLAITAADLQRHYRGLRAHMGTRLTGSQVGSIQPRERVTGKLGGASEHLRATLHIKRQQVRRLFNGRSKLIRGPRAWYEMRIASRSRWGVAFKDAWILLDRDTQAQDNAEHLYRWLRSNRPDINAWFVLRRTSSDWGRLEAEGFRLIAFGSSRHMVALRFAHHLISSHVDHYVVQPWDDKYYGRGRWSYTFLQHGVTKDDISRWLNGKPISMIVAAAERELESFAGDDSPYVLTAKETKLTGFPRHDALLTIAEKVEGSRNLILVMPTWREFLLTAATARGNDRSLVDGVEDSAYVTAWRAYLTDPRLQELARSNGARIAFMPHPNLERHIDMFGLPHDVEVMLYRNTNVQEVIARAKILVTDYSSLAFEAAYIRTPVVYFQFDRHEFFSLHPHRPGYFDYDVDGFGPVVEDLESAVSSTTKMLTEPQLFERYRTRAEEFFPPRDGENCARTVAAIERIREPGITT